MDAQELRNLQEAYMEVVENQILEEQYQIIIPYLIEEGYAETIEEAEEIYVNLDEASKSRLANAAGKLAMGAAKVGAKLAWKGTKAALRAVRDYGGDYPIGSKRRAVADTIDKVHWATLSDKEKKKRMNAKHRARNTKKGHEEIMARNRRRQEISQRWHEKKGISQPQHESYDLYDIILSHLLDEGYAETPEAAEVIMVNMSEEWRDSILSEGEKPLPYGRMMKKSDELAGSDDKKKRNRAAKIYLAANSPKGPKIKVRK